MTNKHGGARINAGRKKKEETTSTGFRINTASLKTCRQKNVKLNSEINEFVKQLANNLS